MKKKQRNLIIAIAILLVCVIAYFIVLAISNKSDNNSSQTENTISNYFDNSISITKIQLISEKNDLSFALNSSSIWSLENDTSFPVKQLEISNLVKTLSELTYFRELEKYDNLSDYNLENPPLIINCKLQDGTSVSLGFSDIKLTDGSSYFIDLTTKKLYTTATTLVNYKNNDLYFYYQKDDIPDISSYDIKSVEISVLKGDHLLITKDKELTDLKTVELGEEVSDKYAIYKYSVINSEGAVSESFKANEDDTSKLYNFLTEFCFNNAVNYNPTDDELLEYGLLEPQASVTIKFNTKSVISTEEDETDFTYTLNIGYPVNVEKAEYYVSVNCQEKGKDKSYFDTKTVYKMNAIYCEYYLEMNEEKINGVYSSDQKLLADDNIPYLTDDNINSITINTPSENILISKDDNIWTYTINNETSNVNEANMSQMLQYITKSGLIKYIDKISLDNSNASLSSYDLLIPAYEFIFNFDIEDNDGNIVNMNWTLYINQEANYVYASNASYVYSMSDLILDYLTNIDSELLAGNKKYGSETETPIN